MKEIEVTDDYLGLDEDVRHCQNKESFEDCTTRQYTDTVQNECNCVPYSLNQILKSKLVTPSMSCRNLLPFNNYKFSQRVQRRPMLVLRMSVLTLTQQNAWRLVREYSLMSRSFPRKILRP